MLLGPLEIQRLLPHGPGMQLIDQVTHFDPERLNARSARHRDSHNPLRQSSGLLPVTAGLEFAGQATALHGALVDPNDQSAPRQGFIVMARDVSWTVDRLDDIHSDLEIEVTLIHRNDLSAMYHYDIAAKSRPNLMQGRMAVYFQGASI